MLDLYISNWNAQLNIMRLYFVNYSFADCPFRFSVLILDS